MANDITAFLQTFTSTNTVQTASQPQPSEPQAEPGLFDALVAECMEEEELIPEIIMPENEQELTFTGNNTFSQEVLDILVGNQEEEALPEPEIQPENDDTVIWPDNENQIEQAFNDLKDFALERFSEVDIPAQEIAEQVLPDEVIEKIPDTLREDISQVIEDIADILTKEDGSEPHPVMKMLSALSERIAPKDEAKPAEEAVVSDDDEETEIPEDNAEFAGLAGVMNTQSQAVQGDSSKTQSQDVLDAPARQKNSQTRQTHEVPADETAESQEAADTKESGANFREVLANRETQQENSDQQDTENQSQSQNQSQQKDNGSQTAPSRSRNDSRRVDSSTQTDTTTSTQSTRRTESRSDFASYFEGVLTSRRTASTASPQPLDLRTEANFTQATTLRDGITNVVRFIRADGVQKARVVVDPPALGRISVELTSGTSGVEASIKVSSEQIRQLVQDQLSQLRMNLAQQGVQVAEFTVDVQQDNSGGSQHSPYQQEQSMLNFVDDDDDETEEFRVDLEEGLLYWVA